MSAKDIVSVEFELNGRRVSYVGAPQRRLLEILREDHGLTGAKPGCGIGRCGACMVYLDEQPVNACLLMAFQLQGRRVRTIEAVAADPASRPVREALARCGAVQCGYCSAGLVMTLHYLQRQLPAPSAAQAVDALSGNLCRCTGYGGMTRAIDVLFGDKPAD